MKDLLKDIASSSTFVKRTLTVIDRRFNSAYSSLDTEEVVEGKAVDKQEIFPSAHDFDIRRKDRVARLFSAWWVESLRLLNARVMRLRTGKINHYILFALLFIVLVFLCSILNLL